MASEAGHKKIEAVGKVAVGIFMIGSLLTVLSGFMIAHFNEGPTDTSDALVYFGPLASVVPLISFMAVMISTGPFPPPKK